MITFTPNGKYVLVANEGEPNSYNQPTSVDPEGFVRIIDMTVGAANLTQADVRNATFNDAIPKANASTIRKYGPNATLAQDLEPEYSAVSHDSKTAWVTLQENNAIGILDIEKGGFTRLVGLGFKNHSLPGNGLDASERTQQFAQKRDKQHHQLAGLRPVSPGRHPLLSRPRDSLSCHGQ
jgi:hypothetical protein